MQLIENHYPSRQLKTCVEKVEKKPNLVDLAPLWECSHILCPEEQNRRGGDHSLSLQQSRPHVCVSHLVCTGSDTLEVWSRILRHFQKRELMRIKEEFWWEKVVYYLFYPAVQYVWRHTRWLSLLQATTPLLWKLAARRSEHGRRLFHWSRQNIFSRPSPCGVASNSQHVKSLGVQIAEQGGRFFSSETKYLCFLYAGPCHVLLLSVSERTPQMWNLLVQRAQNKTGGCPGQLVAQAVLFVSPPKRATFFFFKSWPRAPFVLSLLLPVFVPTLTKWKVSAESAEHARSLHLGKAAVRPRRGCMLLDSSLLKGKK